MIHLETPRKFSALVQQAHQVAEQIFRPNSVSYTHLTLPTILLV